MEREVVEGFKGQFVGTVREDSGRDIYSKGLLIDVLDSAIIIEFHGSRLAISLDSLKSIRELRRGD